MSKFFHSRLAIAAAASAAVLALMVVSVGTVQAVVVQEQEEADETKRSEAERRAVIESRLHRAKEALHGARELGALGRLRMVQELRDRSRAPMVELRRLRSGFGGGMADRVLAMGEEIGLTEQQEEQIRDARRAQRRAEIERDAQIEVLDLDLDELLEDRHSADLAAVEGLMQRRAALRVQGQVADMRASQDVWNSLTAEQQEKMDSNRHFLYRRGGDRPHSLFFDGEGPNVVFDGGDFEFGDMELGRVFDELRLEGLQGLKGLEGLLELQSEDGAPFIWRFERKSDDDVHEDHEKKEKATTEGTAVGVSWDGRSTRTMN